MILPTFLEGFKYENSLNISNYTGEILEFDFPWRVMTSNRKLYTFGGLNELAHAIQGYLYLYYKDYEHDVAKLVGYYGVEFAGSAMCHLLFPGEVDPTYVSSKLNMWLTFKGVKSKANTDRYEWNPPFKYDDKNLKDDLIRSVDELRSLSLGSMGILLNYLSSMSANFAATAKSAGFEEEAKPFVAVAAIAECTNIELLNLIGNGGPLEPQIYMDMLHEPLAAIGVDLILENQEN